MDTLFLVYLICFGVGLIFTIGSAFMADVFGGHDFGGHAGGPDLGGAEAHAEAGAGGHAEAGFGSHDMPGFSPLSPTTLASFVTAFGGIGILLSRVEATRSPLISAPLAVLGGLGVALLVFWLFRTVFRKTQASSESFVAQLVGAPATVVTPIGAGAVGEIAYVDGGTRYTAPARAENGSAYVTGQTVRITRIAGTTYFVSRA
jgi:membrane protein implicated in regulation of membrane protease activity